MTVQPTPIHYDVVLEGELDERWAGWFLAEHISVADGRTSLRLAAADQAALFGVLRRIHDLNLHLISITRTTDHDQGAPRP